LMHRQHLVGLSGAILALVSFPSAVAVAASGSGTMVSVRVEGKMRTLLGAKNVTTQSGWITKGGAPTGACSASSAAGALDLATRHRWSGTFSTQFQNYFITKVLGESETSKKSFWAIFVNNVSATVGICGIQLHSRDKLLFAAVSPTSKRPVSYPTAIHGPSTVTVGNSFRIQVVYFDAAGKARPLAHARVSGSGVSLVTNAHGSASIKATKSGTLSLRTSPPGYVRSPALTVQEISFY
ncbi:MAG TPA: DUF4430 domain-containing protein, partial [Solirubrobacteraceae bacterium]